MKQLKMLHHGKGHKIEKDKRIELKKKRIRKKISEDYLLAYCHRNYLTFQMLQIFSFDSIEILC